MTQHVRPSLRICSPGTVKQVQSDHSNWLFSLVDQCMRKVTEKETESLSKPVADVSTISAATRPKLIPPGGHWQISDLTYILYCVYKLQ